MYIHAGVGDDVITVCAGADDDDITYTVSVGEDRARIDGGSGNDNLRVTIGDDTNYSIVDGTGNTMYQSGTGGSVITVVDVERGQVIVGTTVLYEW